MWLRRARSKLPKNLKNKSARTIFCKGKRNFFINSFMAYIYWLIIFVWLPIIVLWAINWKYLSQYKKTFLYCIIWALIFSIPWDIWAVQTQIWLFPQDTNIGFWIGGLPLEEYLFMIFVTLLISTIALLLRKRVEAHL